MSKLAGKYGTEEIQGVRCRVIESGLMKERAEFLKEILEFNKLEVKIEADKKKDESAPDTFKIGVTDLIFNPTIAIYERSLKHKSGKSITPEFWNQDAAELKPYYWTRH